MLDKYLLSQFDVDLNVVLLKVLEMGGFVELQIVGVMYVLNEFDCECVEKVIVVEEMLNVMEVDIDQECGNIIVWRQFVVCDLCFLMLILKMIMNFECVGDEVEKIVKCVCCLIDELVVCVVNIVEIKVLGEMVVMILCCVFDVFVCFDMVVVVQIVKDDKEIDQEFCVFVCKFVLYMQEDLCMILVGFEYLFIVKVIEWIGDYVKNIVEFIIYIVKGIDVWYQLCDMFDCEVNS